MNDAQLQRYARHVLLDDIGIEGQRRILASHAVVVGAGGLGSPVALYLGSAGVGRLTMVDDDTVDLTNLQRQIAHGSARLGLPKALSVRATLAGLNPDVQVDAVMRRADRALLDALLPGADVVVDCSDNWATRQAVNAACVGHAKPLVSGAASAWSGQVTVVDPRQAEAPCYACVFPTDAAVDDAACATLGVFAPLVGIVGSVMAAEALKLLCRAGEPLAGRLLLVDARSMRWDEVALSRRPDCTVCGGGHTQPLSSRA